MIFQHINNIHLARLDLNEPVCILIPKVVFIADNIAKFGDVPTSAAVPVSGGTAVRDLFIVGDI